MKPKLYEARRAGTPEVSVIVPVVERHGDLGRLHAEFSAELDRLGKRHEFLFVVAESQPGALPALAALQQRHPGTVSVFTVGGRFGEAAALSVGMARARGDVLVTLAAYFQVDPSGLADAFAALAGGADVVAACRHPRRDPAFNRLQSRLFHGLLNRLNGTDFHDTSCGLKMMRRRVARALNVYGDQHRFIPVLARHEGFLVREVRMPQRTEDAHLRAFSPRVYLGRLLDILAIFFLTRFTRMPLRFFGLLGGGLFALGGSIAAVMVLQKYLQATAMADRPLLLLAVLLMVLGVQSFSLGLVSEILIFTHARNLRVYKVAGDPRPLPRDEPRSADGAAPPETEPAAEAEPAPAMRQILSR
jgi:glycosyltransferase involved in cell wall biosynthesis